MVRMVVTTINIGSRFQNKVNAELIQVKCRVEMVSKWGGANPCFSSGTIFPDVEATGSGI